MKEFPEFWLDVNYYIGSVKSYSDLRTIITTVRDFFITESQAVEYLLETNKADVDGLTFMYGFPSFSGSPTLRDWMKENLDEKELEKIGVYL